MHMWHVSIRTYHAAFKMLYYRHKAWGYAVTWYNVFPELFILAFSFNLKHNRAVTGGPKTQTRLTDTLMLRNWLADFHDYFTNQVLTS